MASVCGSKAHDDSIALRLSEFIIAPEMLALSTGSILRMIMLPKAVDIQPLPLEEVVDHDELHEGGDEHGASTSHGIVSSAYVARPPPHPPAPTVAAPIPPVAPPIPPTAIPLIPPTVPAAPFQLNPNFGAFVA
ncbi:hypothetical protein GH714_040242 [Hevea brasiliensis]|uniref:Uncharacterized protein n=1 Tax=Hevea brasiliensis TaxID=3981 RepID=A0A6A6M7V1_HEVBR|nr:hypothetical protein GH714_040242 [Hevea brasiliensis]